MILTLLLKEINLYYTHRARPNFLMHSRDTPKTREFGKVGSERTEQQTYRNIQTPAIKGI